MTEGPLDLTVPLNIAAIRAALATTGPRVGAQPAAPAAADASVASARPQEPARTGSRHGGSPRRLGRIAAFVAVAAALSVGTAGALVLSNNSSNPSVSLPASGAIPVAPSTDSAQPGHSQGPGSSAHATPSRSRSSEDVDPIYVDHSTTPATATSPTVTNSAPSRASSSASKNPSSSISPPEVPIGSAAGWKTLYQGQRTTTQQAQETSDVQTLLNNIGYLQPWRHRAYVLPTYSSYVAGPDANGYYGSATSDAIATLQENYGIAHTGQPGDCDAATYEALIEIYAAATLNQSNQTDQTAQ